MGAPRPRYRPTRCRRCPARAPDAAISYNGLCADCQEHAVEQAVTQMAGRSGPVYERWKAATLAAAARLLDETG